MAKHNWQSIKRDRFALLELSAASLLSELECAVAALTENEIHEALEALDNRRYHELGQLLVAAFMRSG